MRFINKFSRWMNKTLTVLEYGSTYNATTGEYGPKTYAAADPPKTFKCAIWNKAEAERYISEQFREDVTDISCSAVVSIPEDARLTDGSCVWSVLTRQDIANQGEVLLIGMKRVSE